MAITVDFVADVMVGTIPFTVTFTDTSTGSPTDWLWEFGDGFLSKDQNPTHTYRKLGTFSVRLTAWKNGSVVNVGTSSQNYDFVENVSGTIYDTFADAQTAFNATLPYTDWSDTTGNPKVRYNITSNAPMTLWLFNGGYFNRNTILSSYTPTTHVAWMELRIDPLINSNKLYQDGFEHALTIGKLTGSIFDGNESTFELTYLPHDGSDIPIYNMVDYFGDSGTIVFRCIDAFEYSKLLTDIPEPPSINGSGYNCSAFYPFHQVRSVPSPDDLGSTTKVNFITANDNIITRPAILYSGIKEAYFKDGWENEKYLYIEQSTAHPCVVQFIDIYAETENDN